ncbi:MAG: hypothetical protein U0271_35870 [Polyangiaceae bacterium]
MVPSLKRLGSEIATAQDEELRAFDMQAQRARLLARASQKKRPTRALLVGLAFAAALALFWLWSRPAPLAFSVAGGPGERGKWISAPVGARTSLDFSDGSVLTLEGGARARVTSLDAQEPTSSWSAARCPRR